MNRYISPILFLVLVLGGALALRGLSTPGAWYAGLAKPFFNPPAWLFGPVWTVLYMLIAVAGWRVWQREYTGWPMKLWWTQMALNFLWTPVYFGAHQIGLHSLSSCSCSPPFSHSLSPREGWTAWRHGCSFPMPPGWRSRQC